MKSVKPKNKNGSIGTILSLLAVVILIVLIFIIQKGNTGTTKIVSVKKSIYPNGLITADNLIEKDMSTKEYNEAENKYLLWKERDKAVEKWSKIFVISNGYLLKGQYTDKKPLKNAWLSNVPSGRLIVTIPYDYDTFGSILTPGDRVKVNITYAAPDTGEQVLETNKESLQRTETLFQDLKIIDMLNNSGNSIYDYYTDILSMSITEREKTLRDKEFISKVSPVSIILDVEEEEEFNRYCLLKNQTGIKYDFGLYPRKGQDDIIDQFQELNRQIASAESAAAAQKANKG